MKKMSSMKLREEWLKFFESKKHLRVESKSLIPVNDPSLLWINSGVATLKDFFSGKKQPPCKRLTNSQKAIRTNDIENVGITSRHHTLFEMLGNFSIGDYFKEEAIEFGWEFITKKLEMDPKNIYITYFKEDDDTYKKWISIGVEASHLIPGDKEMNFWDMGLGPCGPDTEIFFDRGEKYGAGGPEWIANNIDNDRYIEIWNIVFSQFNNDGNNNYTELKVKNIDTGAGLERIASILQGGHTNFDTDLFIPIIKEIEKMTNKKYNGNAFFTKEIKQVQINKSFKIIADHMRAIVNAINDGAKPSNNGRGYIIRRLIRRSYINGLKLGIEEKVFLYKLTKIIKTSLPYNIDIEKVSKIIKEEEINFTKTIDNGKQLLNKSIVPNKKFDFGIAFKLFETYGFPVELTQDILKDKGVKLDISQFDEYKKKHAQASKDKLVIGMDKQIESLQKIKEKVSHFVGYESESCESEILFILDEKNFLETIEGIGFIICKETPFYATSGGQRHDKGFIVQGNNKAKVLEVFKDKFGNHIHKIDGKLNKGKVYLEVDHQVRNGLMRNHSGTHLLFKALREVFGEDVIKQLGSNNNEDRLKFDFPANKKISDKEIEKIEKLVNGYISKQVERKYIITNLKGAQELGAVMTIDENDYDSEIRVVEFPNITKDLCSGTHIPNTSQLEVFKIISVDKKGSGIFRIEAITSNKTVNEWTSQQLNNYKKIIDKKILKNKELKSNYEFNKKAKTLKEAKEFILLLKNDNKKLKKQNQIADVSDIELTKDYYIKLDNNSNKVKNIAISLRNKYPKATIVIGSKINNKIFIAIASQVKKCNKLFQDICKKINCKGGGSENFAQGMCDYTDNIQEIIEEVISA